MYRSMFLFQYDIDGDGMLDILFTTYSGDLMFYTANGTAIHNKFMQVHLHVLCTCVLYIHTYDEQDSTWLNV